MWSQKLQARLGGALREITKMYGGKGCLVRTQEGISQAMEEGFGLTVPAVVENVVFECGRT